MGWRKQVNIHPENFQGRNLKKVVCFHTCKFVIVGWRTLVESEFRTSLKHLKKFNIDLQIKWVMLELKKCKDVTISEF